MARGRKERKKKKEKKKKKKKKGREKPPLYFSICEKKECQSGTKRGEEGVSNPKQREKEKGGGGE